MDKLRIDKWLWSVRIFKTRTLASNECRNGSITLNGKKAKPSSQVLVNDELFVSKNGFNLHFKILKLISKRVSAPLAEVCYENLTTEEEMNKFKNWYIGKGKAEIREPGSGRPTKKERREIDNFKDELEYGIEL
jgi:ribosome-associated heat shock protein Hsp15